MIGVVADDTTGANDIGLMFSKNSYSVKIISHQDDSLITPDSDILIIDTDSRLDSQKESYDKVFSATHQLKKLDCSLYFNKTCSVFRGNIGQEFDAMLDALEEEFAIISLAFPKNGRKTINGIHTVHGRRLENSEFANDPVHPMKDSNLVNILQAQTNRKVLLINLDVVRQGVDHLKAALKKAKNKSNYCIVDSETQEDLLIVAEAIHDYPIICGSSAIAEELPKFWSLEKTNSKINNINILDDNGVLVVSGSLTPQTKAQTKHLIDVGITAVVLDSQKAFVREERQKEIMRIAKKTINTLSTGKDVLLMADNREEVVAATKQKGLETYNMDSLSISKLISDVLAEATKQIVNQTNLKKLIIAGGDTSGTVTRKLGIKGNYVLKEIQTGLPSGLAIGRGMFIVLKSGSFGTEEFLEDAIEHLKKLSS